MVRKREPTSVTPKGLGMSKGSLELLVTVTGESAEMGHLESGVPLVKLRNSEG